MEEQFVSRKMLALWDALPSPSFPYLRGMGMNPTQTLNEIAMIPELHSAMTARESAIVNDSWYLNGEGEALQLVRQNFENLSISTLMRQIFESVWYGFSVLYHPMEQVGDKILFKEIYSLPSFWFAFDKHRKLVIAKDGTPVNITIGNRQKEAELVQYRASFQNPYGEGLLARLFWTATWLKGGMELWASYVDRFGDDSILARTELSSPQKRQEMLNAIKEFRSSGGMVVGGGDSFEVLKTEKNGTNTLFKSFHEACAQQISKMILGHAMAMDAIPGKLGSDSMIELVRRDIILSDKAFIGEVINRLIRHLCQINGIKDYVEFLWIAETVDEKFRIERDSKIQAMGFKFSKEYIMKAYNLDASDLSDEPKPIISELIEEEEPEIELPLENTLEEFEDNIANSFFDTEIEDLPVEISPEPISSLLNEERELGKFSVYGNEDRQFAKRMLSLKAKGYSSSEAYTHAFNPDEPSSSINI